MTEGIGRSEFHDAGVVVLGGHLGSGPAVVRAFQGSAARIVIGEFAHHPLSDQERGTPGLGAAPSVRVDLADPQSIARFFDECERQLGGLAIVVLVAPPVRTGNALEIAADEYRRVIDQELLGPILCIQEAARRLVARQWGRIISFASMSGKTGVHRHVGPYAAAKGGLIAFSRVLAAEVAASGVTVNVIATALFDVQVAAMADKSEVERGIPVGRVGRSEEAAHAVLYLSSKDGGYVTGETLNLSGGRFMD